MGESLLQQEIKQTKPFRSVEAEALLSILRTADHLRRGGAKEFEAVGITEQQYNVLRILRGAGEAGLPTLEIAERLIEQTPGITRLIDRLETKKLVRRMRTVADRRQVYCFISEAGLDLLRKLDPVVDASNAAMFRGITKAELKEVIATLAKIRNG